MPCKKTVLLILTLLMAPDLYAAKLAPSPNNDGPKVIDTLLEQVKKGSKSKSARKLSMAYRAYLAKKYEEVGALTSGLAGGSEMVGDYALYLNALALRELAQSKIQSKKYSEARELARKALSSLFQIEVMTPLSGLVKKIPDEAARCELIMGDSYALQKQWIPAKAQLEKSFQRFSRSGNFGFVRPKTLGHYALSCSKIKGSDCGAWVWKLSGIFPKNTLEFKELAKKVPSISDRAKAPTGSGRATQSYRTSEDPDLIAFDAMIPLIAEDKRKPAKEGLQEFLDKFPRSTYRHRARYWLAVMSLRDKESEKSTKLFEQTAKDAPLTFYGLLSANSLNKPVGNYFSNRTPSGVHTDSFLTPAELFNLNRAEKFLTEGLKSFAAIELQTIKARTAHSNGFLLYLAALNHEAENHSGAFVIVTELIQRGFDGIYTPIGQKFVFPTAFRKKIEKYATQFKVDPVLVMSLVKQESGFDPSISSPVGAHGLMQIMPATASDVDDELERADLTDPDFNLKTGIRYLKTLLDRYNGNIALSLAAYNAGPAAVNRWIKANLASKGVLEFIEQIPYRETREYVGAILRNYYWYAPILDAETPKDLAFFWPPSANATATMTPAIVDPAVDENDTSQGE